MDGIWNGMEKAQIQQMMHYSFVGSKETIATQLSDFVASTRVNEIMVVSHIFDHKARLSSYEILSSLKDGD
jgi:alkanesulfonate monooxygenase SsuD/methylene tetrahydromethanopterin reductase-like flavin-dependent oxidoreductase (luciferase family)